LPVGDNNFTTIRGYTRIVAALSSAKVTWATQPAKKAIRATPLALGRKCFAQLIMEEIIINAREQLFAFIHAKKFQNAGGPG
jgi:hypothetical protein